MNDVYAWRHSARRKDLARCASRLLAAVTVLALSLPAGATDLIRAQVDQAQRRVLTGQGVAWARAAADRGAVPATLALQDLTLVLRRSPERQAAYDKLLAEQQDPASPNYHRWLTPSEIGERFGASQHDLDALSDWLRAQGLRVDAVANNRLRIRFSGDAAKVASAFSTPLHYFRAAGQLRVANTREPEIPAAFADAVQAVIGLSTIAFTPALRASTARMAALGAPQPTGTNCPPGGGACSYVVFPADFATIYNLKPLTAQGLDGSGQTIAIVSRTRVNDADIRNFQDLTGLATKYPTVTIPPTGADPGPPATTCSETGTPSCGHPSDEVMDQSEATLDVQRAGSVAPGATIELIASANKNSVDGIYIALDYAIDGAPTPAEILSISYATCETDNIAAAAGALDDYFSQAAMQGTSVFVASGDGGVAGCAALDSLPTDNEPVSINLLCASSHVTCVGGTEFADQADPSRYWNRSNSSVFGSARGYIPEGAWNEPLAPDGTPQMAATGGGVSRFIATPPWQVGVAGVPGTQGRYTPDVSFNASTREGYFTCFAAQGGSCAVDNQNGFRYLAIGGTSASAPSMAGITALLNQRTGGAQANLNPRLYALARNPANGVFHDVTVASSGVSGCTLATPSPCNNSTPGPNGLAGGVRGYQLGPGYDLPTGLGSLDATQLVAQWNSAAAPAVNLDQRGLTGSWYNPATGGQGLLLEVYPDYYASGEGELFGGWFSYDTSATGGVRWYSIQGGVRSGNAAASMPIYQSLGGQFASPQPTTLTEVGQATLGFSDCTHGTLDYVFHDGSGRSGSIPLTRLLSNISCAPGGDNGATAGSNLWGGTWYDPADSGQGLLFDIDPMQNVLFAAWYTYAADAPPSAGATAQRWYTLQAPLPPGARQLNNVGIYANSGGVFDKPPATTAVQVGSAKLAFNNCGSITLTYSFTAGENKGRQGVLPLQRVGPTPAGCQM